MFFYRKRLFYRHVDNNFTIYACFRVELVKCKHDKLSVSNVASLHVLAAVLIFFLS